MSIDITKLLASGVASVLIDRYILKDMDMTKSLYFAGATMGGFALSNFVTSVVPLPSFNMGNFANGKTVMSRVAEVGLGTTAVYFINKSVLNNENYFEDTKSRLVTIVASDVIGEYVSDYVNGRVLSYLA